MPKPYLANVWTCLLVFLPQKWWPRWILPFAVLFKFKKLIRCSLFIWIGSTINTHVSFLKSVSFWTCIVNCNIAPTFGMFKSYDITTMDFKLLSNKLVGLSVVKDHPLFKILTDIGFKPVKQVLRIPSSFRRLISKLRRNADVLRW